MHEATKGLLVCFARGAERNLVDENDLVRDPPFGQFGRKKAPDFIRARGRTRLKFHE